MIEISKEVMEIENEILELVDEQEEYSRSDLQGRAMAIAHKAIKAGIELQKAQEITRQEFMEYFRSDKFSEELSADDSQEIFIGALKGSSDITFDLLDELCNNYGVSLKEIIS